MSVFSYNGLDFGQVRTATLTYEPVLDPSGVDLCWHKVTLEVTSVINMYWLATGRGPSLSTGGGAANIAPPVTGGGGPISANGAAADTMSQTLARMRQILEQPRKKLLYQVGLDLVIESPPKLPDGTQLLCDCDNGPIPGPVRILQIVGDVTALVSFTVVTYLNDCKNYIVSNRWRTTHNVDKNGYTSRTTTGTAILRTDFLHNDAPLTVDSFRRFLLVPVSQPMQRQDVRVEMSEDNATLNYSVLDVETTYGVKDYGIVDIEGTATAGSELAHSSTTGAWGSWFSAIGRAVTLDLTGAIGSVMPKGLANVVVRITGKRDASKRILASRAVDVACDRLGGDWSKGDIRFASCYITQSFGSKDPPWVEFRASLYVKNMSLAWMLDGGAPTLAILNYDTELKTNELGFTLDAARPTIGGSSNTRGDWREQMAYQALTGDCQLPAPPTLPTLPFKPDASDYR